MQEVVSISEHGLEYEDKIVSDTEVLENTPPATLYTDYITDIEDTSPDYFYGEYYDLQLSNNNKSSNIEQGYVLAIYNTQPVIIIRQHSQANWRELKLKHPKHKILFSKIDIFYQTIESHLKERNLFLSINYQRFLFPKANAFIFSKITARIKFVIIFMCLIGGLQFNNLLGITANIIYLIQNFYKIFLFAISFARQDKSKSNGLFKELPIYTILIPLYREAAKVTSILEAIARLNYPKDKLDVKIILENDDYQTLKAVQLQNLPSYIHVIKVPASMPRTKPKACNYAMQFAIGKYAVIYDAEDNPDSNQLLDAVLSFENLPEEYACLQARLNIVPHDNDLLGYLFKLEYDMWFSHILKGMAKLKLPMPLGGTSNHFKVNILRKIGLWDPFNVTEDAEIGIRLNIKGYKVGVLDSVTDEDSVVSLKSWFKQRVRWIKGFIITFICYLLHNKPKKNFINNISVIIFLGFSIFSFFMTPFIVFEQIRSIALGSNYLWFYKLNLLILLVFFWSVGYLLTKINHYSYKFNILLITIFPFYFALYSIATYIAILEILYSPFRWNKTDHGYRKKI